MKLEHIGIAVNNLATSVPLFEKLLNSQCYKTEQVSKESVNTAFLRTENAKVELLEDPSGAGPVGRFLASRGEGIHHIAFEVEDIQAEMERLRQQGFRLLSTEPEPGADNKLVCFLHPKSSNSVLIELCMERK